MKKQTGHVNIDGDVVVYAAGFAAQKTWYIVDDKSFDKKATAKEYCEKYSIDAEEIISTVEAEPLEFCLSTVKRMLKHIIEGAAATTYDVVLTGEDNFRNDIATIQPYKGNRVSAKPRWYAEIVEYLKDVHGAIVTKGEEADDYLSYRCYQHGHTIATIDKDLNNTPGWHYNWNSKELYYVTEEEATRHFYTQLLTGDSTDNIPGLYRVTGVRAWKEMKDDIAILRTPESCYEYVYSVWKEAADDTLDVTETLTELGRLLWMRRYPEELWKPPTT